MTASDEDPRDPRTSRTRASIRIMGGERAARLPQEPRVARQRERRSQQDARRPYEQHAVRRLPRQHQRAPKTASISAGSRRTIAIRWRLNHIRGSSAYGASDRQEYAANAASSAVSGNRNASEADRRRSTAAAAAAPQGPATSTRRTARRAADRADTAHRREERVLVHVRAGHRQQPRQPERLRQHLGVRIPRDTRPRSTLIASRPAAAAPAGRPPDARPEEVQRQHAEDGGDQARVACARQALDARIRSRSPSGRDAGTGRLPCPASGSSRKKPMNRGLYVRLAHVLRKEQRPHRLGTAAAMPIADDELPRCRDLNSRVHVNAGILAADDVFGRRRKQPQRDPRQSRAGPAPTASASAVPSCIAARSAPDSRDDQDDDRVGREQPLRRSRPSSSASANARPSDQAVLSDDAPERPLVCRQALPPVAVGDREPKHRGAGQVADEQAASRVS